MCPLAYTTRDSRPTPVVTHGGRRYTGPIPSGVFPGENQSEVLLGRSTESRTPVTLGGPRHTLVLDLVRVNTRGPLTVVVDVFTSLPRVRSESTFYNKGS